MKSFSSVFLHVSYRCFTCVRMEFFNYFFIILKKSNFIQSISILFSLYFLSLVPSLSISHSSSSFSSNFSCISFSWNICPISALLLSSYCYLNIEVATIVLISMTEFVPHTSGTVSAVLFSHSSDPCNIISLSKQLWREGLCSDWGKDALLFLPAPQRSQQRPIVGRLFSWLIGTQRNWLKITKFNFKEHLCISTLIS